MIQIRSRRWMSAFLAFIILLSIIVVPASAAGDNPVISIQEEALTPESTSVTVNLTQVPSSGILRVVELAADEAYDSEKLNSYKSLHFSLVANLKTGDNTLALEGTPTAGKQVVAVLRDSSVTPMRDSVSDPVTITAAEQPQGLSFKSTAISDADTSITVTLAKGITSGLIKIIQLDANETYDEGNFADYDALATIPYTSLGTAGDKTASIEAGSLTAGKILYAVLLENGKQYIAGPIPVTAATQVSFTDESITQLDKTVHVNVSGLPTSYVFRILELNSTYSSSDFAGSSDTWLYTGFSNLVEGENEITLNRAPTSGKKLYAVVRDTTDTDHLKDYVSQPVMVSSAVEKILSGCSVDLSFESVTGVTLTVDQSASATAAYTLNEYVDTCRLVVAAYPPNASYDSEASVVKGLFGSEISGSSGAVTCDLSSGQAVLKPGMKLRAYLYICVGGDDYRKVPSKTEFTIVDDEGNGFIPYQYPAVNIAEKAGELKAGDQKLHLTLTGDERLFELAKKAEAIKDFSITLSVQQYPADETFDFEGSYMHSLVSNYKVTEAFTNQEFTLSEPLIEGYKVRAVVYWSQDEENWIPKGNDYEFTSVDNSVIVAPADGDDPDTLTAVIQPSSVIVGAESVSVNLTGTVPQGAKLFLYQYPKNEAFQFGADGNGIYLANMSAVAGFNTFSLLDKILSAENKLIAVVLDSAFQQIAVSEPAAILASAGAPAIQIDTGMVTGSTSSIAVTVSGDVPEGSLIIVHQHPKTDEYVFGEGSFSFVVNQLNVRAGTYRLSVSGLSPDNNLIAVILSEGKVIAQSEPAAIALKTPFIAITETKITTGDTKISGAVDFEANYYDAVSYTLYSYTGDTLDESTAKTVSSGTLTRPVSGFSFAVKSGTLEENAKLIAKLTLSRGDRTETCYSAIRTVEAAPNWATPTVSINAAAVRVSDTTIPVTVTYDEGYLSIAGGYYCNITAYQFPSGYTDDEFEQKELHENTTITQRIAAVNAAEGEYFTTVELPVTGTLTAGKRLIVKLRLPHPEWDGEEADYLSMSIPVIGDEEEIPVAKVLLFNLGEETSAGEKVRAILKDLDIEAVTIEQKDINETVGYLAGLQGYEPVNDPYTGADYDAEFILMSNLSETQLDKFLAAMTDAGVSIGHKAVVTEYTKEWPFIQLLGEIAEEHDVFQALLALNEMIQKAEQLDSDTYGDKAEWADFQTALANANDVLASYEPTLEQLEAATETLKAAYLALTGMTELTGDAVITITPDENGTYTMTAEVENGATDRSYRYQWSNGADTQSITGIPAEQLIRTTVTITAENALGKLSAQLAVPAAPAVSVTGQKNALTLTWDAPAEQSNRPLPTGYHAAVYQNGELIKTQDCAGGERSMKVSGLSPNTEYTVKLYAESPIGRSDMVTVTASTTKAGSSTGSSGSSSSSKYSVSVEAADNGKIAAAPRNAAKGDTVTVTVKPDAGYEVDKVIVTDKNGDTVRVKDKGDGLYTFTMPASKVTVDVTFTKAAASAPVTSFRDVSAGDWFAEAAVYAAENNIMVGNNGYFLPNEPLTRGMTAQILYNLEGGTGTFASIYADVSASDWYAIAVSWVSVQGIMSGYGTGLFGANDVITREQLAMTLYQYAKAKGYDVSASVSLDSFADGAKTSDWAKPAMQWAAANGLISGKSGNRLDPQGTAARAEVASILMRFCETITK